MTQDEIIRMAREAGFGWHTPSEQIIVRHSNGSWIGIEEQLERFAALVAAHEREACAKVCDEHGFYGAAPARDIRARGN